MKPKPVRTFLSAEWRKLVMINYEIDPQVLLPYLPAKTELDTYNGKHLVSLVGFMFLNTKVLKLAIPFHTNFEEFNLRFYVKHLQNGVEKRGVVFINEIVPGFGIPMVANTLYRENYICRPMKSAVALEDHSLSVSYSFKNKNRWNSVSVSAEDTSIPIEENSLEEFITEHYWGYNKWNGVKTLEYEVTHPKWEVYPVKNFNVDIQFEAIYPKAFSPFLYQKPHSVLLAEGSEIAVKQGRAI